MDTHILEIGIFLPLLCSISTIKSEFVAAATITFDDFLLRPLIEGGCYLRAATIPNLLI